MSHSNHYKSNLRDIEFNLFEVFGAEALLGHGPFADIDRDTAVHSLREVDRMACGELAHSFASVDRHPPVYHAAERTVTMPKMFTKAYHDYMEAGFWRLSVPSELGGHPAPATVRWAIAELVLGSNPPIHLYSSGPGFATVMWANGTERDKQMAHHMIERSWGGTMVLTEPDAGSDVGSGRTKAYPQPDGTWHIDGVKRFITSGDHDMSENIIHFVLARPVGVDGAGGPGTKGLSLFIVPKYHFDLETGELTGEHNGVYATNVEHKMGIKASTTCELTFGADEPAVGWLLGEVHDGIAQMFQIIEHARMLVGTKAMATLSTGYLNALEYAKHRVQGADLARAADKTAPRVTITHHPDVRRSLLTQKSYAEALRALVMYTATFQDKVMIAQAEGRVDEDAEACNDLLLPIVKGYGSERAWVLLGTESLQTLGGSGFLQDYPIEQYVRDSKIDTLYEGTTAIQGQDLFFRKIIRNKARALGLIAGEIQQFLAAEPETGLLKVERELLGKGLEDVQGILGVMVQHLMASDPAAPEGDIANIYKVGLNTSRLLMVLGDVVCAYLLLRQADVALTALEGEVSEPDRLFYEGKVASARFFARNVLPKVAAERAIAETVDLTPMEVPEGAF